MREAGRKRARYVMRGQYTHLTMQQLREMAQNDQLDDIASKLYRVAAEIPGTRPYWTKQRRNLEAMIRQLGCPAVFITLSAADIHWYDLHMHLQDGDVGNYIQRMQRLNQNPVLAAEYFKRRVKLFIENILYPLLDAEDHWLRYEWQHRSSSHVHGVFWLKNAPNLSLREPDHNILRYWDPMVTAMNPMPGVQHQMNPHPSSIPRSDMSNTNLDLSRLLHYAQRHSRCTRSYCLRRSGNPDNPEVCRFGFPKPYLGDSQIITTGKFKKFEPK